MELPACLSLDYISCKQSTGLLYAFAFCFKWVYWKALEDDLPQRRWYCLLYTGWYARLHSLMSVQIRHLVLTLIAINNVYNLKRRWI